MTITQTQQQRIREFIAGIPNIPVGLGAEDAPSWIAAINMALCGLPYPRRTHSSACLESPGSSPATGAKRQRSREYGGTRDETRRL